MAAANQRKVQSAAPRIQFNVSASINRLMDAWFAHRGPIRYCVTCFSHLVDLSSWRLAYLALSGLKQMPWPRKTLFHG